MSNTTYTITLSQTEKKSLEHVVLSPQDWIENAATNRARIAKDKIIDQLVVHCNANNIQLAVGDSDQVAQAYELGVVKTLAQMDSDNSIQLP